MSYCVNCGVELAASEAVCPLCDTPVVNPNKPKGGAVAPSRPDRVERVLSRADRRYGVALVSLFLLVPVIVTMLSNYFTNGCLSWSLYVTGGCMLLFVFFLLPYLHGREMPYLFLIYDYAAVCVFLAGTAYISGGFDWFFPLGLPLATSAFLFGFSVIFISRKKGLALLQKMALYIVFTGVFVVAVETSIKNFRGSAVLVHWSLFALLPCVVLAAVFLVLNRQRRFKDEVRRRLFF